LRCRRQNRKITIQTPTRTANTYGEPIETWTTYAIRWAEIKAQTGSENFNGYQEVNKYPVEFTIRYDDVTKNISEKMRVSYNSKTYDIEAVVNYNEQNKEIHIYGRGT